MSVQSARRLIIAHRPELAERELRGWLAVHPRDPEGHALLGWSLALQKRRSARETRDLHAEAVREAETAAGLAPDWAFTHAMLADVFLHLNRFREAEQALRRAIALDPSNAQLHANLAAAILDQPFRFRRREALRMAESGLALDPGHAACARVRAVALMRLLRFREARAAADFALRLDPENSYGHAVSGWAQLVGGSKAKAREHLREALRVQPTNDYAQRGLRKADEMVRFGAAILLEAEESPAWLRAAAALLVLAVAATIPWGHEPDTPGWLVIALGALVMVDVWTIRLRLTARGRARMAELRQPGALTRSERITTRGFMVVMIAIAQFSALTASIYDRPQAAGAPDVWHLPWNH